MTEYDPTPPEWELFDLKKDPGEMNNLYYDPEHQLVIQDLKSKLIELKKQYEDTDDQYPELLQLSEQQIIQ